MSIRRTVTTTAVALALVVGGGAAWAADDPENSPGRGARNGGWAGEDCPAGLDPAERAERQAERATAREAFRGERGGAMGAGSDEARAERDAWREQRADLVDQIAAAETDAERTELVAQLEAARDAYRTRMTELRTERRDAAAEVRDQWRSGRSGAQPA